MKNAIGGHARFCRRLAATLAGALAIGTGQTAFAQGAGDAEKLSLRQAVNLAVQNSREIALARVQSVVAEKSVDATRAMFQPNLYAGSGIGYARGYPQTISGAPPTIFNVTYAQSLLNGPLRGELHAQQERAEAQRQSVESVRDAVILRAATAYLELAKARRSLEWLRKERESAQKITDVTRERLEAGLELPMELTKAQLSSARIEQRIVQLEGREDTLDLELHGLMALPADRRIEVSAEDLPATSDLPTRELVRLALAENSSVKQAEAERRAREFRFRGERNGYLPTIDLFSQYGLYARYNFSQLITRFHRNSFNIGLDIKIPIFSARTSASVAVARTDLNAAEIELKTKRRDVEIEIRQKGRRTREMELGVEVARLELQLAEESLRVTQSLFQEGRASLRDVEKARLEESDKWLAFLDADYARQQAQLEVLRTTGQLARLFQ